MHEAGNPIDDLRESFERIAPSEAQRARWTSTVEGAISTGGETRAQRALEPIPWRLLFGSALAAGLALALVLVDFSNSGPIQSDRIANAITQAQEQLEVSMPDSIAIVALAPSPALVVADEHARMLLDMEWPEVDALDPGLREVWDQVAGAILRPITRLSAQLETGV